jgi:hypothetical protein
LLSRRRTFPRRAAPAGAEHRHGAGVDGRPLAERHRGGGARRTRGGAAGASLAHTPRTLARVRLPSTPHAIRAPLTRAPASCHVTRRCGRATG